MSKPAFTPGPWTYGHIGHDGLWVGPSHDQRPVAVVDWDTDNSRPESRANARMIAAAPDMYEALCKAETCIANVMHMALVVGLEGTKGWDRIAGPSGIHSVYGDIHAARSKAEGRS